MFKMTVKELKELLNKYADDDEFCAEGGCSANSGYEFTQVWVAKDDGYDMLYDNAD